MGPPLLRHSQHMLPPVLGALLLQVLPWLLVPAAVVPSSQQLASSGS
jgi:hypothetical protein